ncbi:MAG: pyridoxal phosphate-dependent aminotransferase [Clostridia bacterium]|nr:pyridoxal phosphate-dependent aminotransferase [Clostridia bacterium]
MINDKMYALGSNRSVIRDLFEYGNERAKLVGRENIYDFSLGNPSVPAPKEVNEAIADIIASLPSVAVHGYTSAQGSEGTRRAIAEDLNARFGTAFTPAELYISCGAAASLVSTLRALIVGAETEIIGIAPFFPEYRCFVEANGGRFVLVPADEKAFQIDFGALEGAITANTAAVIINSPNNPSGTIYSEETIKKLAGLLEKKSAEYGRAIYLISDEPYRELVYDGESVPFPPLYYKNTIVCYSYSKSLSLPGERIGYVLVPAAADESSRLYAAIAGAARACGYVCAPSLLQRVIERCAGIRPDLTEYASNRDLLYSALTEIGYRCVYPKGAFYMFIEAPDGDGNRFSEHAKKYDLLLVPGESFGCRRFLRISYCVSGEMIEKSISAFRKAFEEYRF